MKPLCRAVVLILAVSSLTRAQSMDIRQTGDYTLKTGDSPDTARQMASLDADLKALGGVGAFLVALPSMKSLGLTESELAAYLAGIIELPEPKEVIRLRPNSALGHFNAATALADMEKDEEATQALREAVRLNPNHHNAHYNLGEMLRLTGNLVESAKEFREYVNRAPDGPGTQRNKERARSFIKAFEEP